MSSKLYNLKQKAIRLTSSVIDFAQKNLTSSHYKIRPIEENYLDAFYEQQQELMSYFNLVGSGESWSLFYGIDNLEPRSKEAKAFGLLSVEYEGAEVTKEECLAALEDYCEQVKCLKESMLKEYSEI